MRHLNVEEDSTNQAAEHIRLMRHSDLPGLMEVQQCCYGSDHMESAEVYRDRIESPMQCSLVAVKGELVLAYLAAYRSSLGSITPLHGAFLPSGAPDTLYLHDMAVHPDCAGQGLATALFSALWQQAGAWSPRYSALVSVQGSQDYWQRKGYALQSPLDSQNTTALETYGEDAVYMVQAYAPA